MSRWLVQGSLPVDWLWADCSLLSSLTYNPFSRRDFSSMAPKLCSTKTKSLCFSNIIKKLSRSLDSFDTWMVMKKSSLYPGKSTSMAFTKSRTHSNLPTLSCGGNTISWKSLRISLDNNLRWKSNPLDNTKWGAHPGVLLRIVWGLALPHLDYGSIINGRYTINDRTHLSSIRYALSLMRCTATNILHYESFLPPLSYRPKLRSYRYVSKAYRIDEHTDHTVVEILKVNNFSSLWNRISPPPMPLAYDELIPRVHLIIKLKKIIQNIVKGEIYCQGRRSTSWLRNLREWFWMNST